MFRLPVYAVALIVPVWLCRPVFVGSVDVVVYVHVPVDGGAKRMRQVLPPSQKPGIVIVTPPGLLKVALTSTSV